MPIPEVAQSSDRLHTRKHLAALLSCSERTVDELIAAGQLAAVRHGGRVKVRDSELQRYISDLPSYEPASAS